MTIIRAFYKNRPMIEDSLVKTFDPESTFQLMRLNSTCRSDSDMLIITDYLRACSGLDMYVAHDTISNKDFIPTANTLGFNYILHVQGEIRRKNDAEIAAEQARRRADVADVVRWELMMATFARLHRISGMSEDQIEQRIADVRAQELEAKIELEMVVHLRCLAYFPRRTDALTMKLHFPETRVLVGAESFDEINDWVF